MPGLDYPLGDLLEYFDEQIEKFLSQFADKAGRDCMQADKRISMPA